VKITSVFHGRLIQIFKVLFVGIIKIYNSGFGLLISFNFLSLFLNFNCFFAWDVRTGIMLSQASLTCDHWYFSGKREMRVRFAVY
jgi:hypothetical protein